MGGFFLVVLIVAFSSGLALAQAKSGFLLQPLAVVFDRPDANPGIRMIEIRPGPQGHVSGQMTSDWYGAIPFEDGSASPDGTTLSFTARNINNAQEPTRTWTLRDAANGFVLTGGIWESHLNQVGRRARGDETKKLAFHEAKLPALQRLPWDGLAKTPPMGWSSWNKFADHIDDGTIRTMADAMVASGLRDAGYRYINIDDGWQGERATDGELRPNAKFPDMRALADYVHARGLKLGIYSSPGPRTCAGYTGSYGHVAQDARTFARWGIDYLKYDLCSGEWFYASRDTVTRSYAEMGAALRATGRPILYSICEYGRFNVGSWGRSVGGHLWRTTGDIADRYADMARIGFEHNGMADDAGPGGWNDPDMLEIGNGGMTDDEYRTHMTLWAMSAAPLLMGHDLRETSPSVSEILASPGIIAIDQDTLGRQGQAVRKEGTAEIWIKPLDGGEIAIAVFNRSVASARISLKPEDARWTRFDRLRNVWTGTDLTSWSDPVVIAGHGVLLLRAKGQ